MARAMGRLQDVEPRFYPEWLKNTRPGDPQVELWEQMEVDALRYSRERVAAMGEYIDWPGKAVIDVGCQWGATCIALAEAGARPTGVDITELYMTGARIRAEEHGVEAVFKQGFSEDLPFEDESFDAAIALNIMEHVKDHTETLTEILRVLKPGGEFYFDMPNRFAPGYFLRDPHYKLLAVSTFPNWLGDWYVTKVRKFPEYEVGVFPIASVIERTLKRNGAEIIASSRQPAGGFVGRIREAARFNLTGKPFFFGRKVA